MSPTARETAEAAAVLAQVHRGRPAPRRTAAATPPPRAAQPAPVPAPAAPPVPGPEVSPAAAADLVWLQKQLGRRLLGWEQESDGRYCVTLERGDRRLVWCFGADLAEALQVARATVAGGGR